MAENGESAVAMLPASLDGDSVDLQDLQIRQEGVENLATALVSDVGKFDQQAEDLEKQYPNEILVETDADLTEPEVLVSKMSSVPAATEPQENGIKNGEPVVAVTNGSKVPKKFLREWKPMYELLSRMPKYATKGQMTIDIKFTCVAVVDEFIALGTNVGVVYWYNRKLDHLGRVRTDVPTTITKLCLISTVDYMLAAGNIDGLIAIFQIPKVHSQSAGDLDFLTRDETPCTRFKVPELHHSTITAFEWSRNGMKLFSGDSDGVIALTDIDYNSELTKSRQLLTEGSEIVQLSYDKKRLLVCSLVRSVIYSVETDSVIKIGTQERKMGGRFGGLFLKRSLDESPKLYSVRPNGRVWLVDAAGTVELTIKFKDLYIDKNYPTIPLVTPYVKQDCDTDFQIGVLHRFMTSYLVSWYKDVLFILNPDPIETKIVASCHELSAILDIATNDKEIFILESDRKLRRVSCEYDTIQTLEGENYYKDFKKAVELLPGLISASIPKQPISYFTTKIKEKSRALPTAFRSTLKNVIEFSVDVQDGQFTVPPPVIPLSYKDIPNIKIEDPVVVNDNYSRGLVHDKLSTEDKFKHISSQPFEDVVAQPLRRNKRRKKKPKSADTRFQSSGDTGISDAVSLCSACSTNSDGEAVRRLSSQSDCAQVASSEGSNASGPQTAENQVDKFFSGNMSQSWSPGQMEETVSQADLEAKEEILARRLKWRELLPPSAQNTVLDDEFLEELTVPSLENLTIEQKISQDLSRRELETHREFSIYNDADNLTPIDESENGSSLSTLKPSYYSEFEVAESRASLSLTSLMQLEANGSLSFGDMHYAPEEDFRSLNVFEDSVDIYNMYAPTEDRTGSLESELSFGPPSGTNSLVPEYHSLDRSEKQPPILEEPTDSEHTSVSAAYEDLLQVRDMIVDPMVIENDSWVTYTAPSTPQHIACCDAFVMCTDTKNNVYFSRLGEISLHWTQTEYQASHMALSPCGSVVWRLHKNTLYSLTNARKDDPVGIINGQWSKLTTNVISMSVKVGTGWIVKTDGTVHFCCDLGEGSVIPEFKKVPCVWPVAQICTLNCNVWAVTLDGQLIYRTGVTEFDPKGLGWNEKLWEIETPVIHAVSLGPNNSIWIADVLSNVYFMPETDQKEFSGPFKVTFGEFTSSSGSPSLARKSMANPGSSKENSSFSFTSFRSKISDSFRPDRLTSLLSSKKYPILGGCLSSMWFSTTAAKILHVCKTQAEGHAWAVMKLHRMIKGTVWADVFGGNVYHEYGYLWVLDSKGKLFYLKPDKGEVRPVDLPCSSKIITVTPAPDALWILNSDGIVFGRCNLSSTNPIGHGWDKIDTSTLGDVHLIHVSCGSDVAWGCDDKGKVYMRVGSLRPPGFADISPVWLEVEGFPSNQKNCVFTKVYVGSNGNMVWALDNLCNVYVREAVYPDYPIGTKWLMVSGIDAVRLALSDQAVWALSSTGDIYKRHGITGTNFVGDYWKKVLGNVKTITVSVCDQVWALDSSSQLLKHYHAKLNFKEKAERKRSKTSLDPEDKDWELIDSL